MTAKRTRAPADPARNPEPAEVLALRESLGLSQSQVVARLPAGITVRTWQAWEQGERRCPPYAWAYVRAQLGVLRLPEKAKRNGAQRSS
jgi:DNA-binding transcriptional regulator YiaG